MYRWETKQEIDRHMQNDQENQTLHHNHRRHTSVGSYKLHHHTNSKESSYQLLCLRGKGKLIIL